MRSSLTKAWQLAERGDISFSADLDPYDENLFVALTVHRVMPFCVDYLKGELAIERALHARLLDIWLPTPEVQHKIMSGQPLLKQSGYVKNLCASVDSKCYCRNCEVPVPAWLRAASSAKADFIGTTADFIPLVFAETKGSSGDASGAGRPHCRACPSSCRFPAVPSLFSLSFPLCSLRTAARLQLQAVCASALNNLAARGVYDVPVFGWRLVDEAVQFYAAWLAPLPNTTAESLSAWQAKVLARPAFLADFIAPATPLGRYFGEISPRRSLEGEALPQVLPTLRLPVLRGCIFHE